MKSDIKTHQEIEQIESFEYLLKPIRCLDLADSTEMDRIITVQTVN